MTYEYNFQDRMATGRQSAMDARNRGRSVGSKPARQHKRPVEDNEINRVYADKAHVEAELRQAKNEIAVLKLHAAPLDDLDNPGYLGSSLAAAPRSLPDHASLRGPKPGSLAMSTTEYLNALQQLGLTRAGKQTAAALGLGIRQLIRLAQGAPVNDTVALLLKCYLQHGLPT